MRIRLFDDQEALSQQAAADIFTELNQGERCNFAPTGGSSPLRLYQHLVARLQAENAGQQVHYYLQDDVPLRGHEQQPGVIYQHIDRHLLTPAGIPPQRIHPLTLANVAQQDAAIAADGGLDLLLLGVGQDGHIAANLPGTPFDTLTREIEVDRCHGVLMAALVQEVGSEENVPDSYLSFGIQTIMQARHISVLINGENKAEIVRRMLMEPPAEALPASVLQRHANCTLYLDAAAACLLDADWLAAQMTR